jgi:arylsulfatase A-like enzyme
MQATKSGQLRTLMSVDDLVGRVARTLGSLGERRQTVAFFLSDNGFLWGEHGLTRKGQPYTPSISIPLLMRWPGHVAAGSRDSRLAATVDLAPTILEAAGVAPLSPMDGRSLLQPSTREHLFTEYWQTRQARSLPGWSSIRTPQMQYVEYYNDDRSDVIFREYYWLDRDPWQLTNVLRDGNRANNPRTGPLHTLLEAYRACAGPSCP